MTDMRTLDSYGMKWMGTVPDNWSIFPTKRHFDIQLGKMLQNAPEADDDCAVPYLKAVNVLWGRVNTEDAPEMWASPDEIMSYEVRDGDLLVCEGGEVGRAGIVRNPPDRCIIQNALHRVRARNSSSVSFLMYVLHSVDSSGWFDVLCNKATIAHFTGEKFAELRIPLPSPKTQKAVAAFLDRETSRIDDLIAKKQRQIELLQEKRSALISHVVTKGLDPNVKMKDSGVEWLGEIPEHWEIRRLKYLSGVNNEVLSGVTEPDYEMFYVDISSIDPSKGITAKELMTFENAPSRARRKVRDGDVIISTVRTYLRAIAPVVSPEPNMIVSTGFAVIRPGRDLNNHFASYALRAPYFVDAVVANSVGVSYPAINASEMVVLPIVFSSIEEQQAIANFLDRETSRIDQLIEKVIKSIDLLREYRTALISAAVTGKIDVREEVA